MYVRGSVFYGFKGSCELARVGFVEEMAFEQSVKGCLTISRQDLSPELWPQISNCPSNVSWAIPKTSQIQKT